MCGFNYETTLEEVMIDVFQQQPSWEDYEIGVDSQNLDRFKAMFQQDFLSPDPRLPFGFITGTLQQNLLFYSSPLQDLIFESKYSQYNVLKGLQWNQGFDNRFVDIWILLNDISAEDLATFNEVQAKLEAGESVCCYDPYNGG